MVETEFLRSSRLSFRSVEPDDYDFLLEHWNQTGIRQMTNQQTPLRRGDLETKIESSDSSVYLSPVNDGSPVGLIWLFDISKINGRVEVGYWIRKEERGNGFATEAIETVAGYLFNSFA